MLDEYNYKHKLSLIEKFVESTSKYVKSLSLVVLYDINEIYRSDFIRNDSRKIIEACCKYVEFTHTFCLS